MRLLHLGLILIFLAVLIPMIAIPLTLMFSLKSTTESSDVKSNVVWGGAIIIFPIPIAYVFGNNPKVIEWLTPISLAIFVLMAILAILHTLKRR